VGGAIQRILDDEKAFYESDTRDKLKVPPYNYVKRQPRDYTKEMELFGEVGGVNPSRPTHETAMSQPRVKTTLTTQSEDLSAYSPKQVNLNV
jgi:hypothetical protein